MALILAVKPGQRQRQIEVITPRTISDRQRRITGQMSAGRSAGLITTMLAPYIRNNPVKGNKNTTVTPRQYATTTKTAIPIQTTIQQPKKTIKEHQLTFGPNTPRTCGAVITRRNHGGRACCQAHEEQRSLRQYHDGSIELLIAPMRVNRTNVVYKCGESFWPPLACMRF